MIRIVNLNMHSAACKFSLSFPAAQTDKKEKMWQHSLVILLALSTVLPIDVVHAAMSAERVKEICDDMLEKLRDYGPYIIKFIAPILAKKLVEKIIIKLGSMAIDSVGKRDVSQENADAQATEEYLLKRFNAVIDNLKEEFHRRIDSKAVNDQIEDWKETVADVATVAKDKILEFIHEFSNFNFEGYFKDAIDAILGKSVEKRRIYESEPNMQELKEFLERNFGHE